MTPLNCGNCQSQGQRPHVNFFGVRYTNAMQASTAAFLGQEPRIYYHSQEAVRAQANGVSIHRMRLFAMR